MELKEKIIKDICRFGEYTARRCAKANGLYQEEHYTVSIPDSYDCRRFSSYGEAMSWLMHNSAEILHTIEGAEHRRRHERDDGYHYLRHTRQREIDDDYYKYSEKERMERLMRALIHTESFYWCNSSLEKMTAQELLGLFIALKKEEES